MQADGPTEPASAQRAERRTADVAVLFVVAWLFLDLRPHAPLHSDSSRDLAFARDLVEGSWLHLHGATANFRGLAQGTAWVDFLALGLHLDLSVATMERVITALLSLTVVLTYLGVRAVLPEARAALAERLAPAAGALILLGALPYICEMPIWWQPILVPLPLVLAHVAAWRLLRWGHLLDALALAVFSSLAVDVHVVSAAFAVVALFVVPFAARRPVIASVAFLVTATCVSLLASMSAVRVNLMIIADHGWYVAPLVALAAGVAARRFGERGWQTRLGLALALELGLGAALILASLAPTTPDLAGRYLAPFAPALALALAWFTARVPGNSLKYSPLAGVAVALVAMFAGWSWLDEEDRRELPAYPDWTAVEFEPIAEGLVERGSTWTELVLALQGPQYMDILGHLCWIVEPGTAEQEPVTEGLLIVAVPEAEADSIRAEISSQRPPLAETGIRGGQAFLISTTARANRRDAQLCRDGDDCDEVRLAVVDRVFQAYPSAFVAGKSAYHRWQERGPAESPELLWKIPIGLGDATVMTLSSAIVGACPWSFVDVEGFRPSADLPSEVLEIPEGVEGHVWVSREWNADEPSCLERGTFPPPIVETDPSWVGLRELLEPTPQP